jgi:hypothetical protein
MVLHLTLSLLPACSINVIITLALTVEIPLFALNTLRAAPRGLFNCYIYNFATQIQRHISAIVGKHTRGL